MSESQLEPWLDPALEARVVARILGQASDFEAAELDRILAENPELAAFARRIQAVHGLLGEAAAPVPDADDWKLDPARRSKVLDLIGKSKTASHPGPATPVFRRWLWLAAAAALTVSFAWVGFGSFGTSRSPIGTTQSNRSIIAKNGTGELSANSMPESPPLIADSGVVPGRSTLGESLEKSVRLESAAGEMDAFALRSSEVSGGAGSGGEGRRKRDGSNAIPAAKPIRPNLAEDRQEIRPAEIAGLDRLPMTGRAFREGKVEESEKLTTEFYSKDQSTLQAATRQARPIRPTGEALKRANDSRRDKLEHDEAAFIAQAKPEPVPAAAPPPPASSIAVSPFPMTPATPGELGDGLAEVAAAPESAAADPFSAPELPGSAMAFHDQAPANPFASDSPALRNRGLDPAKPDEKAPEVAKARKGKEAKLEGERSLQPLLEGLANQEPQQPAKQIETTLKPGTDQPAATATDSKDARLVLEPHDAQTEPVSTFSLHVSDASLQLAARALLTDNKLPDPKSVRTEDFVNGFDYGDPLPDEREAVGCVIDQVANPFISGRNLVRIGLRTAASGRAESQPLHLTVLLDNSGSMERPDREAAVSKALQNLSDLLKPNDLVSVVGFARTPRLIVDRLPGDRAPELLEKIQSTPPEGGTDIEAGLNAATEIAARAYNPAAQNRVVVITDGGANLGRIEPERLGTQVESLRQNGIALDTLGVGTTDLDDNVLKAMARRGDGRYLVLDADNAKSFAGQLAGAFRPAARNVKVQVRFNPDRVARYALLGFEEHRLSEADFRNDAVDAAELAAAESGNAVYQIALRPDGHGDVGEVSVRFQDTATGNMIERKWTISYDPAVPTPERAPASAQIAATAALLGESLRGTGIGQSVDLNQLTPILASLRSTRPADPGVRLLDEMVRAANRLR